MTSRFPGDRGNDDLLTLREAAENGVIPWRYEAAKKRLQKARRGGTAPDVVGKRRLADLYREGDLIAWRERERAA